MRRRGFPLFRGRREADDLPPALQRAHDLMARGDYNGAAIAFEQLAKAAEARQGPRAPFFFVQAGNARIHLNRCQPGWRTFVTAWKCCASQAGTNSSITLASAPCWN